MWDKIIEGVTTVNNFLNDIVWGWPVIILILGTGILLTIMTKFLQVRKFKASLDETIVPTVKSIGKKGNKDSRAKSVSQFEAFSTAISGTVGTGNIIGVTSAILTGGPGAVFWMWISAFFGMVTNYSENVLGLYFRKKGKDKELAYRLYKIKSNSETFNCYMMADPTGKKCALSLCKGKLIVMDGTTQETVFYCAKPKQNKDNEPALAFPILFNFKDLTPQLQSVIAIELSQLE